MAESTNGADSIVEVRVRLAECVPEIWRVLELAGSLSLGEVHEVLQVAFGWEDVHLHRFTADDPFARLRPVDVEIPETPQWLPAEWCEEPEDLAEEHSTLEQLLAAGAGAAFYEYDFGDSWLHRLELVARRSRNDADPPARLLSRRYPSKTLRSGWGVAHTGGRARKFLRVSFARFDGATPRSRSMALPDRCGRCTCRSRVV